MITRHRNAISVILPLGGLVLIVACLLHFLFVPPEPVTGLVRNDLVYGPGRRQYRREVQVQRAAGAITTTVTFTDTVNGGVGTATYIQPDRPLIPRWKLLIHEVKPLLGLPVTDLADVPLMVIPYPMTPGQKWTVRFLDHRNSWSIEGRGKAPRGAVFDHVPSSVNPGHNAMVARDRSIVYGERIQL